MRKPYEFKQKTRTCVCRICGKEFTTKSAQAKYCKSPECRKALYDRKIDRFRRSQERRRNFLKQQKESNNE